MLHVAREGPVLRLTLDRPEVRNAFNDELIAALSEAVGSVGQGTSGSEIRAVVLSGTGKAFCAGGDLEWMRKASAYSDEENYQDALRLARLFEAIVKCPAVVIAKVHGAAFGGGCGLVACADVAVCDPEAKFAFSEVRLGLLPATISPFVIPKIGSGHARALFATGATFDAERALRIGLVHEVAPQGALDVAVENLVRAVLSVGPKAASEAKLIAQSPAMRIEEAAKMLARARASDEGKEGVRAFLEKRKAAFVTDAESPLGDAP
jgi:methylglutaconyl-CoA hydratase